MVRAKLTPSDVANNAVKLTLAAHAFTWPRCLSMAGAAAYGGVMCEAGELVWAET